METKTAMPTNIPPQEQAHQPGSESQMDPQPIYDNDDPGFGRLRGKVAIITGGDSGIGRAVAILFAKEGAEVAIVYLDEHDDAKQTADVIKSRYDKSVLLIAADLRSEENNKQAVQQTIDAFGHLDIVVNNAAVQYPQRSVEDISEEQLRSTFETNIFAQFFLVKHALPYLKEGSSIINTTSVTAYKGNETLIDYSSTKGAIVSYTRSLAQSLIKKGIRVNAVAPGPVWTPLIPSSFDGERVASFGKDLDYDRPAQPVEIAPCYLFLAGKDGAFMNGQVLHPNGGSIING